MSEEIKDVAKKLETMEKSNPNSGGLKVFLDNGMVFSLSQVDNKMILSSSRDFCQELPIPHGKKNGEDNE